MTFDELGFAKFTPEYLYRGWEDCEKLKFVRVENEYREFRKDPTPTFSAFQERFT